MIDWSKPIESASVLYHRLNPRVVEVDGDWAIVAWASPSGDRNAGCFHYHSPEWRNVPELSERDKWMLQAGFNNALSREQDEDPPAYFYGWLIADAARLAKACPHE